jgi:hypothetical protein
MASDFSAAWQCLSKRTIVFFITDQTPRPYPTRSLPAQLYRGFAFDKNGSGFLLGDFFHKPIRSPCSEPKAAKMRKRTKRLANLEMDFAEMFFLGGGVSCFMRGALKKMKGLKHLHLCMYVGLHNSKY